jgi:ABC-type lipoprotein release transport system permease subunit
MQGFACVHVEVKAPDAVVFAGAALFPLGGTWLPARRATRTDPMQALRRD